MSKTLEDHLSQLDIPLPAAFIPRVLAAARAETVPARRRPRWRPIAVAAVLLLLAFAGSVYAAPRFSDALAAAPLIGGPTEALLRSVGLSPLANRLTPVNDVAVSSGYRIELLAAYADATQTVLIVRSTPGADVLSGLSSPPVMTDQFGRQVEVHGGVYDSRFGTQVMQLDALPWPDDLLGARLTVTISSIQPDPSSQTIVAGRWTLHATIAEEPGRRLNPMPADGVIGTTAFHFTAIERSGPSLEIDMEARGPLAGHLSDTAGAVVPNVSKPHPVFSVDLIDSRGDAVQELTSEGNSGPGFESVRSRWLLPNPGRYQLVVSFEGAGQFAREVTVPA